MISSLRGLSAALLLLAIPLWVACQRESIPRPEEQLVGRWEWQKTASPNSAVITPASTGHRVVVEFDRRGRARFYEDGNFVSATIFSVKRQRLGIGRPADQVLMYRGYRGTQLYTISGNNLQLRDSNGEPFEHSYTRLLQKN
ncbi:hypothetical protein [Hymenobacter sp.]|jgi:hypothetical protein|uniref:hypothetical protein n=1 Tax=Hymenobacter sp. TaxID=1898978 RepID=UPI002EDB7FDA